MMSCIDQSEIHPRVEGEHRIGAECFLCFICWKEKWGFESSCEGCAAFIEAFQCCEENGAFLRKSETFTADVCEV